MVIAPSLIDLLSSYSADRSKSVTEPMPSQRGHMPPRRLKVAFLVWVLAPRSTVIAPLARTEATLNANALGGPIWGFPSRLKRMRSIALASVAVPTVERASAPIRCWSTMIAVVRPSSTSTSGRASVGMKPCTKALYVSLINRCDSAAIVPNTSELLPEPDTPVNTVSRRFGISTLTSLRLFTRAPCTRIRSWLSAGCSAGDCVSVLITMLIVSPSVGRGRLRGLRRRRLARSAQLRAVRLVLLRRRGRGNGRFLPYRRRRPGCRDTVRLTLAGVPLGARTEASTPLRPVEPLGPGHAARPAEASDQPVAFAHQLAVGQLIHLAPGLDAARGDAEPAVRRGQRTRVEAGARGEPVTQLLRQRVDLEDLDFALDHGHVAGVAHPQPNGPGGGQIPAGRAVRRRSHQQRLAVPVEGQRHQIRRTVRRGTGHPEIDVVGEPMLGVATTLSAGAGVGTHQSSGSPRTLPSRWVMVAPRRPPPTSCAGSFTVPSVQVMAAVTGRLSLSLEVPSSVLSSPLSLRAPRSSPLRWQSTP